MPLWLNVFLIVLGVYLLFSFVLYYLQELFLFKPEKLPPSFRFIYKNRDVKEFNVKTRDGAVINGLHFKCKKPKGVVLYLKGNSKSIKGWGKFAVDFVRLNYDVVMVDYRGFGKSTGRRSQKAIKNDMQFIYDKIHKIVEEKYIILYGRSMGSGFATKLASTNSPRMLILDAPYYSLKHLANRYLPFMPLSIIMRYPVPTYKWIKYVHCPIHIIHGTNDKLIPFKSSIKLANINPDKTRLWSVVGGGHKNLNTFRSYHEKLEEIVENKPHTIDLDKTSYQVNHLDAK